MRLASRLAALVVVAGMSMGLAACGTTSGTTTPPTTDQTIADIQATAAKVCAFVPTVSTVTGIIASFVSGGAIINDLVTTVATSICNAIAPTASLRRAAPTTPVVPSVNGVPIQGYFLAK